MILLIISIVTFIAFITANFLTVPKKLVILCCSVCILILCNFLNQIQAYRQINYWVMPAPQDASRPIKILQQHHQNIVGNSTQQLISSELIEEERQFGNLMLKNWEQQEFSLLYIQHLHKNRLKLILDYFKLSANSSNQHKQQQIKVYKIDYKTQQCDLHCLTSTFNKPNNNHFNILIAQNVQKTQDFKHLEYIYFKFPLNIIFQSITPSFKFNSISRLVTTYKFSNNYLSKLLEHQPSKTISHCGFYHNFDYQFYVASQNYPLNQLCSRPLPSNAATRCLRKFIKQERSGVPSGWAKNCFAEGTREGTYEDNGWVYLNKEHFWSDKINQTQVKYNQTFEL